MQELETRLAWLVREIELNLVNLSGATVPLSKAKHLILMDELYDIKRELGKAKYEHSTTVKRNFG